jgi:hypothetical protein
MISNSISTEGQKFLKQYGNRIVLQKKGQKVATLKEMGKK